MLEDVARTVHIAREAGPLIPIPQDAIDRLYDRYQNVYGQAGDDAIAGDRSMSRRRACCGDPRGRGDARDRAGLDPHQGVPRRGRRSARPCSPRAATRGRTDFVDRLWTYSLEAVWSGLQAAFADLVADVAARHGVSPEQVRAIGVSAMMHGYLAFDEAGDLLVPFRTWRNTNTGPAAAALTEAVRDQHPAALVGRAPLPGGPRRRAARREVRFVTTLAGYVHWPLTGRKVLGVGDACGMFPIDATTRGYDAAAARLRRSSPRGRRPATCRAAARDPGRR